MKRFSTCTEFIPFEVSDDFELKEIKKKDGSDVKFKTRKAVEDYCLKHSCIYVEKKYIFYK